MGDRSVLNTRDVDFPETPIAMQSIKEEPLDPATDWTNHSCKDNWFPHVEGIAIKEEDSPVKEDDGIGTLKIVTVNGAEDNKNLWDQDVRYLQNLWSDEATSVHLKVEEESMDFEEQEGTTGIKRKVSQIGRPLPKLDVKEKVTRFQITQKSLDKQVVNQSDQPEHTHCQPRTTLTRSKCLVSRLPRRCCASSGKLRNVSKDIICLPVKYLEENDTYRVPQGKEQEQLALMGLVGKVHIQSSWSFECFRTEVASLFLKRFTCSAQDFSFTFLQCLPGNRKLIKPNVSANFKWRGIAIINLAAQGSLYIKTQHTLAAPAKNLSLSSKQSIPDTNCNSEQMIVRAPTEQLILTEETNQKKTTKIKKHVDSLLVKHTDHSSDRDITNEDHTKSKTTYPTMTTNCVFKLLRDSVLSAKLSGLKTEVGRSSQCEIIPIEWMCWRIATGTYMKRHPNAAEENRLSPPKVEMFSKDESNNQIRLSVKQVVAARISCAGLVVRQLELDIMNRSIVAMLEILERACLAKGIIIVNLKVRFGVETNRKEIVLADVVGYDSRSLNHLHNDGHQNEEYFVRLESQCKVVLLTESLLYLGHCEKIKGVCAIYSIPCELRVTSAYTGPGETLAIKSQYEGDGIPTVFITVSGRSNGLASILSANTTYPVINCPVTTDWTAQDVCSAVKMTEGLGFSTVLSPEAAAQFAAHILGLSNHGLWSKLRTCTLNKWIAMKQADVKLRACSI